MKETTQSPSFDHIRDSLIDRAGSLIAFAYLMGSAATERFHSGSDVDLATLNEIDVIFGRQVLESGRELLVNEPGELLRWKADQMSRYPDFKYSRRIVEDHLDDFESFYTIIFERAKKWNSAKS